MVAITLWRIILYSSRIQTIYRRYLLHSTYRVKQMLNSLSVAESLRSVCHISIGCQLPPGVCWVSGKPRGGWRVTDPAPGHKQSQVLYTEVMEKQRPTNSGNSFRDLNFTRYFRYNGYEQIKKQHELLKSSYFTSITLTYALIYFCKLRHNLRPAEYILNMAT